jgi:hypothetical protein
VRATTINDDMKVACAHALAELAREDVPDEVAAAYRGNRPRFGPEYIIPVPFDPRLISAIPSLSPRPRWIRAWREADSQHGRLPPRSSPPGAIRSPRRCSGFTSVSAAIRAASSSPRARKSR